MTARQVRSVCVAMTVVVLGGAVQADRLHLEGGGTIDAETWWVDGETIHYEGPAGTVGIAGRQGIRP